VLYIDIDIHHGAFPLFMGRSAAFDACAQAMEWKKLSSPLTV
jgi:hypothetical protein